MVRDLARPIVIVATIALLAAAATLPLAAQSKGQQLCDYAMEGELEEVQRLLSEGVDANSADEAGESALMYGASSAVPEIVEALLEAGADPNRKNSDGGTALISAVISDGELDDDEYTAYRDIVRLLLAGGAKADVRDNGGKTALDYAREYRQQEMVEILESSG